MTWEPFAMSSFPCRPGVLAGLSEAEEEGVAVRIDPQLASMCWSWTRFRWGVGMMERCNVWEYRPTSQIISATTLAMLLYSASAELLLTVCCFLDFQDMSESPSLTIYPVTDLLVLGQAAQSESQNASSSRLALLLNNMP